VSSVPAARRPLADLASAATTTGAALVAATGAIHLYLWFDYFRRVHVVGALFLANAGAGAVLALALLALAGALVRAAGAGYCLGTVGAFLASARWGLFGYHERLWGGWQVAAASVELLGAAVLAAAAFAARPSAGL
jgi:hypothetical protein